MATARGLDRRESGTAPNVRYCLRAQAVNATLLGVLLMVCGIRGFVEGVR